MSDSKINGDLSKVKVYVGSDGKLHFTDRTGADTVLPFSRSLISVGGYSGRPNISPKVSIDEGIVVIAAHKSGLSDIRYNITNVDEYSQINYMDINASGSLWFLTLVKVKNMKTTSVINFGNDLDFAACLIQKY